MPGPPRWFREDRGSRVIKKVGGALAAIALFVLGVLLIVGYVRQTEERIVAEAEPTAVFVVSQPVEQGESPEGAIRIEEFPTNLVSPDAVRPGDSLMGLVATTGLVPGEPLLWTRLDEPTSLVNDEPTRAEIPEGFSAVTIPVSAERAFGGLLLPGMRVAVVGSFTIQQETRAVQATHALVQKALIVEVQADEPTPALPNELVPAARPSGGFLVTLAVPIHDVERVVFAAEWGSIWLAQQGEDALEDTARIQTADSIFDVIEDGELPEQNGLEDAPPTILAFDDGAPAENAVAQGSDPASSGETPGDLTPTGDPTAPPPLDQATPPPEAGGRTLSGAPAGNGPGADGS